MTRDIESCRRETRLGAISLRHPSDDDLQWVSYTAVELAAQPVDEWMKLPDELRQNFLMLLTNPDVPHPDVDVFPFLLRTITDPDDEVRMWAIKTLADDPAAQAFQSC